MRRLTSLALFLVACHGARTPSPDAGDARAPVPVAVPKGVPFVVAVEHAVDDAVWLPNGHLLGGSKAELFDLDPVTNATRRIPLAHPASMLLGTRGATRAVTVEEKSFVIWDTTTLAPLKTIEGDSPMLSDDGKRLAAMVCDAGKCNHKVFDLATGDVIAKLPAPGATDYAGELQLSDDGRWAIVNASSALVLADATTGKTILRRKALRVSEGGASQELVAFLGDRVVLTSDRGIEVIALPSGKILAQAADPFAAHEMVSKDVDGDKVVLYDGPTSRLFTWDMTTKKTTLAKVPEPPALPPGTPFVVEPAPHCRLVETATKRVVLEHPAFCSGDPISGHRPGQSPDGRLWATVFEGGAHVFDLATGKHVAGIGGLPATKQDHLDAFSLDDGVPGIGPLDHRLWLTGKGAPKPAPRPAGFRKAVVTRTHTFGVLQVREKRTVVALDRTGKEVLREEIAPFDESMQASDDVAYVRAGTEEIRCQVGVGCKPVALDGFIASFDAPWLVIGARQGSPAGMQNHLLNVATGEKRPLPLGCNGFGAKVFRDGPVLLCPGLPNRPPQRFGPDGKVMTITLPDSAPRMTRLAGSVGPFLFYTGVVNAGPSPAYRIDVTGGELVTFFFATGHAVARFADGKIERFGDAAANDEVLRCLDGDRLLPWSACSAAFTVEDRL